jgi:addiction module HigA family antidote
MLLEEFLRPAGLTQVEAAQRMVIPLNRLNEIINGKRGISADTALRLARLFKTSPEFWMGLQADWDLWHAATRCGEGAETAPTERHAHVVLPGYWDVFRSARRRINRCPYRTLPAASKGTSAVCDGARSGVGPRDCADYRDA